MQRSIFTASACLVLALAIGVACGGDEGGGKTPKDDLSLKASPTRISDQGESSTLTVTAESADGAPGTGEVVITTPAGLLANGFKEETLSLENGQATTTFTCAKASDAKCTGAVRIAAEWKDATASVTVTVGSTDGGTDGGSDGGTDGGSDGGTDGGSDGGTGTTLGDYVVTLSTGKALLIAKTGDQTPVTLSVARKNGGDPVPGQEVTFTTNRGSFAPAAGTSSIKVTTNTSGIASTPLYAANMDPGLAEITAALTGTPGSVKTTLSFTAISTLVYDTTNKATKALIGIESSGRDTTTPLFFKVTDSAQKPVPGVELTFTVSGAAQANVTDKAVTNAEGIASTTLRAGNTVGVAIVKATVTATIGSTPELSVSHPGTPIVGGKPSDRGLIVDCVRKNLGALHATPPPRTLSTNCTAALSDRFGNPIGLPTTVQWYPEAGKITSPVDSKPQTGTTPSADTGVATTVFSTNGSFPPFAVPPMPGELHVAAEDGPTGSQGRNARDMAVTVIAVVGGEEDFYDGSGTNGIVNGRWDPGEWFVDLGEPLVDRNDNGKWDPGEFFIDTERIDCANPNAPATKNDKWDGPNGCWDSNTQIWRPIHIVYTGPLSTDLSRQLWLPPGQPYNVPVGQTVQVPFSWSDAYFNRLSSDGAGFVVRRSGNRGSVNVVSDPGAFAYGGFEIAYESREATTQPDGSFVLGEICNTGKPTPPDSSTSPVKTRCVRNSRFTFPSVVGNSGTINLVGANTAGASPSTIDLQANHAFSSSIIIQFPAVFE
ncbi:hypothetical protein [Stigmatella aurantiaca]|uniref:Big-1 domain-containing protein n=1 Tax=Stigmatella aurantiaca (strain DW4/3-1) TaxID=378806 RepID=Q09C61_STIAD|nr:hypothetical protein [Stigmatella aurantiaca]ADO74346.1 uncharacterized protein STAUR_6589 [Stigmatella aurantiaca DW4/3-1]EAU69264.1 conserved hypothetical protein [Stigmatella aurantiaca DW4/3-1]